MLNFHFHYYAPYVNNVVKWDISVAYHLAFCVKVNCWKSTNTLKNKGEIIWSLHFKNKGVWQNWYHFLGRETDQYVQTKEEWLDFCKEHHITTVEQYKEACNVHACLPTEPVDLYMDFGNITSELLCVRRQR